MLLLKLVVGVVALFSVATASKLETIDNASVLPAESEDVTPYYAPNHAPAYDEWPEEELAEEEEDDEEDNGEDDGNYDYYYEERPAPGGYRTDPDEWDSEEYSDYPTYEVPDEQDSYGRQKRKVIYGRGGYGRRGSRGGSPYGRRRSNQNYHGPDYGPEGPTNRNYGTRSSPMAAPTTPRVKVLPSTPKPVAKPTAHPATTKSKMGRRETKKKLSKDVKTQIAEYAIANGNARAADHFRDIIGKKLSEKTIEKFVKRHQKKQKKLQRNNN